ncbi:MAG: tetratricopeptide repeat protein, partial [Pseudonocardia sp.]|nr:tetratricopeptide repeat protein [Pseudonocardia sp.]
MGPDLHPTGGTVMTRAAHANALPERGSPKASSVVGDLAARHADAVGLCRAGRHKQAIPQLADILADCRSVLGPEHLDTLRVSGNLAVACVAAGRRRDGVPMLTDAVADRSRVLGDEHPETLTARDALAVAYRLAGDADDAAALSAMVTAQRTRVLGAGHPDTLTSRMG